MSEIRTPKRLVFGALLYPLFKLHFKTIWDTSLNDPNAIIYFFDPFPKKNVEKIILLLILSRSFYIFYLNIADWPGLRSAKLYYHSFLF